MGWFSKSKGQLDPKTKKIEVPDGKWLKCPSCDEIIHIKTIEINSWVCPKCDYHIRIGSNDYIQILIDPKTFREINSSMKSADPLQFRDTKKYTDRIKSSIASTGLNDAVKTGIGEINGRKVAIGIMDFEFIGGSMGSVVGEKIARLIDKARDSKIPLIIISKSGGARMMEGAFSLMQMAKTSAKLAQLAKSKIPYLSILTDPTTGGTTASYAMLGDINIAEPNALIGFAGPRVIKQTIGKDLPKGFQKSEFLEEHGFVDLIVDRRELKSKISTILDYLSDN